MLCVLGLWGGGLFTGWWALKKLVPGGGRLLQCFLGVGGGVRGGRLRLAGC